MKKLMVLSVLLASLATGVGISLLVPAEAYAQPTCIYLWEYPGMDGQAGTCKYGEWVLWGHNCIGRLDAPPGYLCECEWTRCIPPFPVPCEWPCPPQE